MNDVWENGEWFVHVRAWYAYPNSNTDGTGENYVEINVREHEGRVILTNLFRVWATRPHEVAVYNDVLWQQLAKEIYPVLIYDYPHLKGAKCEEATIEIWKDGDVWSEVNIPHDKLRPLEF